MRIVTVAAVGLFGASFAHAASVAATAAWVRAPAPGQAVAAAYVSLTADEADQLVAIDAPGVGMAMLHESKITNGVASMNDVDTLALPAGHTVALSPGGMHIMLMDMDMAKPLVPGATLPITLHFAHAKALVVQAKIRPVSATAP